MLKDSLDYLELAAHTLLLQERYADALQVIRRAVEQRPENYGYLMIQGKIYQKLNDQPSAIQSFLLAQKASPQSSEVYYSMGISFFLEEEYQRATRHFRHVVQMDPTNDKSLFMLGVLHAYQEQIVEARTFLEKSLALQPSNPHYRLHYGVVLNRAGDSEGALREVIKAVEMDPPTPLPDIIWVGCTAIGRNLFLQGSIWSRR